MRRKLEESPRPQRPQARATAGWPTSSSSSSTSSSSTPPSFPRSSVPTSGRPSTPSAGPACSTPEAHADLVEAYDFLRTVESRLRIVHNRSGVDLPDDPDELARLARRLNYDEADPAAAVAAFRADAARHADRAAQIFHQVVGQAAGEPMA